jgi:hypothetical protein
MSRLAAELLRFMLSAAAEREPVETTRRNKRKARTFMIDAETE